MKKKGTASNECEADGWKSDRRKERMDRGFEGGGRRRNMKFGERKEAPSLIGLVTGWLRGIK